jgi:predicted nucleotidyltransferase
LTETPSYGALQAFARTELAARPEVRRVVLIGSLARGDWSRRSDADLVLVVDRSDAPGPFRGAAYLPSVSVGVGLDVLVYTPEEVTTWSPRFRGEVERGLTLYERVI